MIRKRYQRHLILISIISVLVTTATAISTVDETSSICILPEGNNKVNIVGSLDNAQSAVFQVTNDRPPVTMQKSLSFQDYMFNSNGKYEYTSFEKKDSGDSLNIMSITEANGFKRFVG
jgi:hypothetical protein